LSWGFNPEDMALFPEIEVNFDVSLFSTTERIRRRKC